MKSSLLLLVFISLFLVLAVSQDQTEEDYKAWKKKYGVNFDEGEDEFRVFIYKRNLRKIKKHNQDPQAEYQEGKNKFTALTQEEFKLMYLGTIPPQDQPEVDLQEEDDEPTDQATTTGIVVNAVAASIDWRQLGGVTDVKNQGSCGSCWAFSTVATLEASFLIQKKVTLNLSEQQLVSCSGVSPYGNAGCNGGWPASALAYVLNEGITTEEAYPYKAKTGTCTFKGGDYKIKSVKSTPRGKCGAIKRQLQSGPVSVDVDADNWSGYKSGVLKCQSASINHAVLLVGYTEKGHWIIKNSWGTSWGDNGYITINKRAAYNCGICKYGCDSGLPA